MMNSSTHDWSGSHANPEAFVGLSSIADATAGVASLDSPLLQQTKSEIRSLASEIAQLAHTALDPHEFFDGFLPRLCVAMGAKAAGVWRTEADGSIYLMANHSLPTQLLDDSGREPAAIHSRPSESHQRILQCVTAEGQPILVPPGDVMLQAQRPTNPLADALIVVPVRVQDDVDCLLEVVQRPSGGPAAQRGYLRFVAQMADLMADYLRREQLRRLTKGQQRLSRIEDWLTAIAGAAQCTDRRQFASDAILDLFDGDRAIILCGASSCKVLAISGSRTFDPRSATVLAAQAMFRCLMLEASDFRTQPKWFAATDRRESGETIESQSLQAAVDHLCGTLGCRQLLCLALDAAPPACDETTPRTDSRVSRTTEVRTIALVAYAETGQEVRLGLVSDNSSSHSTAGLNADEATARLAVAIGALLGPGRSSIAQLANWLGLASPRTQLVGGQRIQRWITRVALVGLVYAVATFPVRQQIAATAVLRPESKQIYYAPSSGLVSSVLVDEGESVVAGQPLFRITSHELETQTESLQIELKKTEDQIAEKSSRLNRGDNLTSIEKDHLEYELRELETSQVSLRLQLDDARERLSELNVNARVAGTISTWDLRNRLMLHPVQSGQALASTFNADDRWRLELSIPDYRAGLTADALAEAENGAILVSYSLASHPDKKLEAFAYELAPQVTMQLGGLGPSPARVVKMVAIIRDASQLPLKNDGAIARATLNCGRVPLIWLVFRDAYWAVSSRVQLFW